jgi:hypothetical protein
VLLLYGGLQGILSVINLYFHLSRCIMDDILGSKNKNLHILLTVGIMYDSMPSICMKIY